MGRYPKTFGRSLLDYRYRSSGPDGYATHAFYTHDYAASDPYRSVEPWFPVCGGRYLFTKRQIDRGQYFTLPQKKQDIRCAVPATC